MENNIAIDIKNVSKVYKMYERPIDRLKETLSFGRRNYHKDFYALDNISFQVKKGDTVGIIGRNGAGKSTLLKIITGVLEPSSGKVKVNGKISSLLELGAGFNPDFTGIENIYLNGTVMGFTREEMDVKLQNILEFADIGDFVYQPVKTYSSGMYVRLAFSVAINVEPDILIVDEALAVGDAEFTLKCLKKISKLKEDGTTILLVTHGIEMLKSFANNAILLEHGKLISSGEPVQVSLEYYKLLFGDERKEGEEKVVGEKNQVDCFEYESKTSNGFSVFIDKKKRYGRIGGDIEAINIFGLTEGNIFYAGNELKIRVKYTFSHDELMKIILIENVENNLLFGMRIENSRGIIITDLASSISPQFVPIRVKQNEKDIMLEFRFRFPTLEAGEYWFSPEIAIGRQEALVPLAEYAYLFKLNLVTENNILGLLKFDYTIDYVR